jgi:antitoxin component YwqK of YwqJK toxin-antitoxin module
MKILVVLFFILIKANYFSQSIPCFQQKRICDFQKITNCNDLVSFDEDTDTYYSKKDSRLLYSGKCVTCYRNGQLKSQISIVNGKQDSIGLEYYESGCLQSKMFYVVGKLDGEITFFYDSTNNKAQQELFKEGIRNGKSIEFENNTTNDTLIYTTFKNNKLDGIKKEFYPNNKIWRIIEYKNGIQNGSQKKYSLEGKIEMEISFKNGKKDGVWHYYFDSGLEAKLENWSEGSKNGEFKIMDEKGLIKMQEFYKINIPIDKHIQNYPDGKPKHITIYDKKGIIIEELSFDEFGTKKDIIKRVEKKKNLNKP